jgi:hypothetical protein
VVQAGISALCGCPRRTNWEVAAFCHRRDAEKGSPRKNNLLVSWRRLIGGAVIGVPVRHGAGPITEACDVTTPLRVRVFDHPTVPACRRRCFAGVSFIASANIINHGVWCRAAGTMDAGQIIIPRTASYLDVNIADEDELVRALALHEARNILRGLGGGRSAARRCFHRGTGVRLAGMVPLTQGLSPGWNDRCSEQKKAQYKYNFAHGIPLIVRLIASGSKFRAQWKTPDGCRFLNRVELRQQPITLKFAMTVDND